MCRKSRNRGACQPRIEIDSGAGLAVIWWEQADLNC
jgi:hypothetical protein